MKIIDEHIYHIKKRSLANPICQNAALETLTPYKIDNLLARFYVEVRRVNEDFYSKSGYVYMAAVIQCHLLNYSPHNVTFSIFNDATLIYSNKVLKGVFKSFIEMSVSVVINHLIKMTS